VQVGADHAQLHPPLRLPQIQGRPAGRWFRSRKSPGQVQEGGVGPGRCDQADPEARAIGPEARRDGDGRQIQEVHEVGVEAKVGVESEGLREDLGNAVDGPGGRQDQNVCGAPDGFGGAGAGGEGVARGNAGAGTGQRARARERMEYEVAVPLETLIRGGKYGISINNERHELEIPTGTEDEELLSIPGRLDVLVRVRADKHAWLTRDERDLSYDLPLSIVEATLGATIDAPLPTGGSVTLKIPAGTASGKKMRIAGKGMPAANGKPAGDLYVVVQIVPPKEPNDLTKSLLKEIGGTIENPRARIAHLRG